MNTTITLTSPVNYKQICEYSATKLLTFSNDGVATLASPTTTYTLKGPTIQDVVFALTHMLRMPAPRVLKLIFETNPSVDQLELFMIGDTMEVEEGEGFAGPCIIDGRDDSGAMAIALPPIITLQETWFDIDMKKYGEWLHEKFQGRRDSELNDEPVFIDHEYHHERFGMFKCPAGLYIKYLIEKSKSDEVFGEMYELLSPYPSVVNSISCPADYRESAMKEADAKAMARTDMIEIGLATWNLRFAQVYVLSEFIRKNFIGIGKIIKMTYPTEFESVYLMHKSYSCNEVGADYSHVVTHEIDHEALKNGYYYPKTMGEFFLEEHKLYISLGVKAYVEVYIHSISEFVPESMIEMMKQYSESSEDEELKKDIDIYWADQCKRTDPFPLETSGEGVVVGLELALTRAINEKRSRKEIDHLMEELKKARAGPKGPSPLTELGCGFQYFFGVPLDLQIEACALIAGLTPEEMEKRMRSDV